MSTGAMALLIAERLQGWDRYADSVAQDIRRGWLEATAPGSRGTATASKVTSGVQDCRRARLLVTAPGSRVTVSASTSTSVARDSMLGRLQATADGCRLTLRALSAD